MIGKRRKFSREFKKEAVKLAFGGRHPLVEVAKELDLRPDMLQRWHKQLEGAVAGGEPMDVERELQRVRRELSVVKEERDILKKALAIVSGPPR